MSRFTLCVISFTHLAAYPLHTCTHLPHMHSHTSHMCSTHTSHVCSHKHTSHMHSHIPPHAYLTYLPHALTHFLHTHTSHMHTSHPSHMHTSHPAPTGCIGERGSGHSWCRVGEGGQVDGQNSRVLAVSSSPSLTHTHLTHTPHAYTSHTPYIHTHLTHTGLIPRRSI